mgnify:CR=1 FL=1
MNFWRLNFLELIKKAQEFILFLNVAKKNFAYVQEIKENLTRKFAFYLNFPRTSAELNFTFILFMQFVCLMIIYRKLMLLLSKSSRRECVLLLDHCCFYSTKSFSIIKFNAQAKCRLWNFTREPLLIARRSRMHFGEMHEWFCEW